MRKYRLGKEQLSIFFYLLLLIFCIYTLYRYIKNKNTILPDPYSSDDWQVFSCSSARQDQPTLSKIEIRTMCETIKNELSLIYNTEEEVVINEMMKICTDKDYENLVNYYPRSNGAFFVSGNLSADIKHSLNNDEIDRINNHFIIKRMNNRL